VRSICPISVGLADYITIPVSIPVAMLSELIVRLFCTL